MSRLFLSNIPCDCLDSELRHWFESHGFPVDSVRVVRDLVSGVSPAFGYVALCDSRQNPDAVRTLNRQSLRGWSVCVGLDWHKAKESGAA